MKYFVLSKAVITGVIHTDIEMHLKSAKYIPASKEALASYHAWMNKHPDKQPTVANIFTSKPSPAKPVIAKSTTNTTTTNANTNTTSVGKPLSEEEVKKKAMIKQFRHFMINR